MKKGVIFDLDGTLVDSIRDITEAVNHAMSSSGLPTFSSDDVMRLAGGGNKLLFQRLIKLATGKDDPTVTEKLATLKKTYEHGPNGHKYTVPFPGIYDMLHKLQSNGVQMAILSNKFEPLVRSVAKDVFPDIEWKYVAGQRDDTPPKPDPTAATRILKEFMPELTASDCIFIGDTDVDMKTGIAAGMTSLGVDWGFRSVQQLHDSGAKTIVSEASEITSFVLQHGT